MLVVALLGTGPYKALDLRLETCLRQETVL
jgi:hypothetical protein